MVKFDITNLQDSKRILDLGCGNGDDISRHCFQSEVMGVDLSRTLCLQAKKKTKKEIICSSGEKLPFISDSFDGVLSHQVIEHVKDDKKFLKEIRRILKNRGKLVISTARHSNLRVFIIRNWGIMRAFKGRYLDPTHLREYSFNKFSALLQEATFDITDFKGIRISFIAGYIDSALWALAWKLNLLRQADKILSLIYRFSRLRLPIWQTFSFACINHKNKETLTQKPR